MDKKLFYYCEKCQSGVPKEEGVCRSCGKRFFRGDIFTVEEIDEKKAKQQEKRKQDSFKEQVKSVPVGGGDSAEHKDKQQGMLKCPICGKSYDRNHSLCDTCGMVLVMSYEPVEIPEVQTDSKLIYGEVIVNPVWEVKSRRFSTQQMVEGQSFVINRNIFPIGRRYLGDNHIFFALRKEANQKLNLISTDNGFFVEENGELFIQYDSTKLHDTGRPKSAIKINGNVMRSSERVRLAHGDVIILGDTGTANKESCVELQVVRIQQPSLNTQIDLTEIREEIVQGVREELGKGLEGVNKSLEEVNRSVVKVDMGVQEANEGLQQVNALQKQTFDVVSETAENVRKIATTLDVTKFATADSYMKAAEECERYYTGEKLTPKQYIDKYLENCPLKEQFLDSLSEAQEEYLYYAAFYEAMAKQHPELQMDYSAPFLYIGKLLENFAHMVMKELLYTFGAEEIDRMRSSKNLRPGQQLKLDLGSITRSFISYYNGTKCGNDRVIKPLAKAYQGENSDHINKALLEEMRKAFVACDDAREDRNDAAHSSLEAMLASELKKITWEEYDLAKKNVIESNFIINIRKYYEKVIS